MAVAAGALVVVAGCGGRAPDPGRDGGVSASRTNDAPASDGATTPDAGGEVATRGEQPHVGAATAGDATVDPSAAGAQEAEVDEGDPAVPSGGGLGPGADHPEAPSTAGASPATEPEAPGGATTSGGGSATVPADESNGTPSAPRPTTTTAPAPADTTLDAEVARLEAEVEAFGGEATAIGQQLP